MQQRFDTVRSLCRQAVHDGVTPALEMLVVVDGTTVMHEAFGHRQLQPEPLPASVDTVWDVASVTKAVVTSVLAMQLVTAGALQLEAPAQRWLPELTGPGKERVTIRHLLSHSAGLPPNRPFYRLAPRASDARAEVVRLAGAEPLEGEPGTASRYSDLGFILLGAAVERAAGARLDALFAARIAGPLRLGAARFVDLLQPDSRAQLLALAPVAATQLCPQRERVVVGEVDDLNAWVMGGIAGHAGLFASAADLSVIAGALTAAWHGDGDGTLAVQRDVIRAFWAPAGVVGSTWRLGWDGPAPHGSLAGELLSRRAVGHLGFTGCSLWIDPERSTWVVLLTNRVHPVAREDARFRALRPALHDHALRVAGYIVS